MHEINGFISLTYSSLVSNAKRKLAKRVVKKEPVTTDLLLAVYSQLYEEGNLKNQRILCAFLLAFSGFLRSAELLNLKSSDVTFEMHMSILIESSKTDRYRDGALRIGYLSTMGAGEVIVGRTVTLKMI